MKRKPVKKETDPAYPSYKGFHKGGKACLKTIGVGTGALLAATLSAYAADKANAPDLRIRGDIMVPSPPAKTSPEVQPKAPSSKTPPSQSPNILGRPSVPRILGEPGPEPTPPATNPPPRIRGIIAPPTPPPEKTPEKPVEPVKPVKPAKPVKPV